MNEFDEDFTNDILEEVLWERFDQHARFGQQDHPSFFGNPEHHAGMADMCKGINDLRVKQDTLTWDGILLEEVYEALAESDDEARRAELIQVAAVAVAEVEAIDRRPEARRPLLPRWWTRAVEQELDRVEAAVQAFWAEEL